MLEKIHTCSFIQIPQLLIKKEKRVKKLNQVLLFVIFILSVNCGCNTSQEKKNTGDSELKTTTFSKETEAFYYESGKIKSIHEVEGGEANGLSRWFYENGKPDLFAFYKDGTRHGLQTVFHENGNVAVLSDFFYGLKKGWELYYFEDDSGVLKTKIFYEIHKGEEKPIAKIEYDMEGNIIEETSRLEVVGKDTLRLHESFEVHFKVIKPEYPGIFIKQLDYDSLFYLKGDFRRDKFVMEGNEISVSFKAEKPGQQYIRGEGIDFYVRQVSDSMGETAGVTYYFEHPYFVLE